MTETAAPPTYLADIPHVTAGPGSVPDRSRGGLGRYRVDRRTVLRGAGAAGAALGLQMLGLLPPARKAYAGNGYLVWENDALSGGNACPPASTFTGTAKCTVGCGPSMIQSDACDGSGWHKNDGVTFMLRPNECYTNPFTGVKYDGWLWGYNGSCGFCPSRVVYRCHDGKKKVSGTWTKSICRYAVQCT